MVGIKEMDVVINEDSAVLLSAGLYSRLILMRMTTSGAEIIESDALEH